jgi:sec-independent protein translocase protein TatC
MTSDRKDSSSGATDEDLNPEDQNSEEDTNDKELPFISHLIEVRDRLLKVVGVILVVFLGLFYFAADLYGWLAQPLLRYLPENSTMIATQVASPFLAPFKLCMVLSIFLAVPYIFYQAWGFIAPGLYKKEQKLVVPLLFSSTLLFYLGVVFAYYVIFPLVFQFFTSIQLEGVTPMTDITDYLDFVLKMFVAFGVSFEVPIVIILLTRMGIVTVESLAQKRPYVIVGSFVVGMIITPPDIISQVLLAIPVWILFEAGLIVARLTGKKPDAEEELAE